MDNEPRELPIGKGQLFRSGLDLAILAIGSTVRAALEASSLLQAQGVQCAVVNARFLKPLDEDLICSLSSDAKRVITVEENVLQGGFGSAVLELFEARGVNGIRVKRLGIPDQFVEHGSQDSLRKKYGIDSQGILRAAEDLLQLRDTGAAKSS